MLRGSAIGWCVRAAHAHSWASPKRRCHSGTFKDNATPSAAHNSHSVTHQRLCSHTNCWPSHLLFGRRSALSKRLQGRTGFQRTRPRLRFEPSEEIPTVEPGQRTSEPCHLSSGCFLLLVVECSGTLRATYHAPRVRCQSLAEWLLHSHGKEGCKRHQTRRLFF